MAGVKLNPLVWGAASPLWGIGQRCRAVAAAAEALVGVVRARTGRTDVQDTGLWQQVFAESPPEPGKPRLRWPGDPNDVTVRTINSGLRLFAPGAQMLIRNPAAHVDDEPTEQVALEQLSALSYLARTVEACELIEAPPLVRENRDAGRPAISP